MSAREDQPVTVPPPAGEDDAYSATTKVGAMPADIMEKLRAEGLLPEDVEKEERAKAHDRETPVAAMRPSTSLEKRSPPAPLVPQVSDGAPVPQLYSTAPPPNDDQPASKMVTAKPPPPDAATPSEKGPVSDAIETPVAFAFPPASQLPKLGEAAEMVSEEQQDTTALTRQPPTTVRPGPSKATMIVVGVLVVLFLIVALMRLRG